MMFLDGKHPKWSNEHRLNEMPLKRWNLNQWLNFCPNLDNTLTFPTHVAFALFLSGPNGKRSYGHLYIFLYCIGWVPCSSLFFFGRPFICEASTLNNMWMRQIVELQQVLWGSMLGPCWFPLQVRWTHLGETAGWRKILWFQTFP